MTSSVNVKLTNVDGWNDFDAIAFFNAYNDEKDEWHRIHFPDGTKRYQYRTEKERVENCRKSYGVAIGENGLLYIRREHPCYQYDGENACEDCIERRRKKRLFEFSDRIDNASDGGTSLFFITAKDSIEQRKIAQRCKYHGYNFISVPTGNREERCVVINGPVSGSSLISHHEAKKKLAGCSGVLFLDRSQRVSGKLGKSQNDSELDERNGDNIVELMHREIIWGDKKFSAIEIGLANAKLARKMFQKEGSVKVTKENAQALLASREEETVAILRAMGGNCYLSGEKVKKFNIDAMAEQWLSICYDGYRVIGNVNGADPLAQRIIRMAMDNVNSEIDDRFSAEADKVATSVFRTED